MGLIWSNFVLFGLFNVIVNYFISIVKFCDVSELYKRKKLVELLDVKIWFQFQLVINFRIVNEFMLWFDFK